MRGSIQETAESGTCKPPLSFLNIAGSEEGAKAKVLKQTLLKVSGRMFVPFLFRGEMHLQLIFKSCTVVVL